MEETKVLWKEEFKVKTPSYIEISDKEYFDAEYNDIAGLTDAKSKKRRRNLDKMTVLWDKDIPKNRDCSIVIGEEKISYDFNGTEHSYTQFFMTFIAKNKDILRGRPVLYDNLIKTPGIHFRTTKEEHELNCERAGFDICINDRYDRIKTGADGGYGYAYKYKNLLGHHIGLYIDSCMSSKREWSNTMAYLFDCEEMKIQI